MSDDELLAKAEAFFRAHVEPVAQVIDQDAIALGQVLDAMGGADLLALRRPHEFGGPQISEAAFRKFQEMSARFSGSLSFLMTQHQSAVSMLAKSENQALKEHFLPHMGDGSKRMGIGFSQLRRPGPPVTQAITVKGGFRVSGLVPWVTGYSFFGWFLLGATLESGENMFAVVPLPPIGQTIDGITVSAPMRLAAMEAPQTVSLTLDSFFLPESDVAFVKPAAWAKTNDMINIVLQGHFALGCAQAGVDQIRAAMARRPNPATERAAELLDGAVAICRADAEGIVSGFDTPLTNEKLQIRARAIELATRCAHAAVVAHGGAANAIDHPAQRIYREALVFSVSAQTTEILEATLDRLCRIPD